jgi:Fe2+ or Zn2+ uptake regulation protein
MDTRNLKLTAPQIKTLTFLYTSKATFAGEAVKSEIHRSGHSVRTLEVLYAHGLIGYRNSAGKELVSITSKGVMYIDKLRQFTFTATKQGVPDKVQNKDRLLERLGRDAAVALNIR